MEKDLTKGNVLSTLISFSIPYMISCFLQTFYGLTDLFVVGRFDSSASIAAVSIGSQIMHMITVVLVGLAMGSTVFISSAIGEGDKKKGAKGIGNTISLFFLVSIFLTIILLLAVDGIIGLVATPFESIGEAKNYLVICFIGIPFIIAYNVISCIFRAIGDSKSPMFFIFLAGVINIVLDFILIGPFDMGAGGAALATVLSQVVSVISSLIFLRRHRIGIKVSKNDLRFEKSASSAILKVGIPIALQDGLVQISFLIITTIANNRGVVDAASVGIVEKIISFLFLVPSAMLSSISVIASQNIGAREEERARKTLFYGIAICVSFGAIVSLLCQFFSAIIVSLFTNDLIVATSGGEYLRSYVFDCVFAGIHFCISGYFCAIGKSFYSFLHNIVSAVCIRIPLAYLASNMFTSTLYPMGWAAPVGSLVSAVICVVIYLLIQKKNPARLS